MNFLEMIKLMKDQLTIEAWIISSVIQKIRQREKTRTLTILLLRSSRHVDSHINFN